jgi:hypothetical protein
MNYKKVGELANIRGPEHVPSSHGDSHGSKKPQTGTAFQQWPVVTSAPSSLHKLNMHSDEESDKLPTGVVNIFPITHNEETRCCCPTQPQRITLASCDVAQVFVSQYGADNLAYLQEREQREFPSGSHTTNLASNTSSAQPMSPLFAQTSEEDGIAGKPAGYASPPPGGFSKAKFSPPSGGVTNARFLERLGDHLPRQPWVTTHMRATVVSWLVEVTIDLSISDEAFHVAISILDRVLRSGVTAEQYRAYPWRNWDADFFCVRIRELQALGWYVFASEGNGVSSCKEWIFGSLPCDCLFPVHAYGWGASCYTSPTQAK